MKKITIYKCAGEEFVYSSADRVADETQADMFPPEYLHQRHSRVPTATAPSPTATTAANFDGLNVFY